MKEGSNEKSMMEWAIVLNKNKKENKQKNIYSPKLDRSDYGGDFDGGDFDGGNNNNRGEKGEGDGICVVPGAGGGSNNDGISNSTVISWIMVGDHMLVVCVMWQRSRQHRTGRRRTEHGF